MNYPLYKITKSIAVGYKDKPFHLSFNELGFYAFATREEAEAFGNERQGNAKYSVFIFAYGMIPETHYFIDYDDAAERAGRVGASIAVLEPSVV